MIIESSRWPEDEKLICPTNPTLGVLLSPGDGALVQTVDGNGNVTGLQCTWSCPCGQQHVNDIVAGDLGARNIPECLQSPLVKATLAGIAYP